MRARLLLRFKSSPATTSWFYWSLSIHGPTEFPYLRIFRINLRAIKELCRRGHWTDEWSMESAHWRAHSATINVWALIYGLKAVGDKFQLYYYQHLQSGHPLPAESSLWGWLKTTQSSHAPTKGISQNCAYLWDSGNFCCRVGAIYGGMRHLMLANFRYRWQVNGWVKRQRHPTATKLTLIRRRTKRNLTLRLRSFLYRYWVLQETLLFRGMLPKNDLIN